MKTVEKVILSVASFIGSAVMKIVQSAKNAFKIVLETIIPFIIFVTIMYTLITRTGLGGWIANGLVSLGTSSIGLLVMGLIITFPLISPLIGPGAVIPQTIGVLIGGLIASGDIPLYMALPALFTIHQPCGADFVPVGLSLTEAEPETAEVGVPATLYSKFLIAPIEIILAIIVGRLVFR